MPKNTCHTIKNLHETTRDSPLASCVETPSQNGVAERNNRHLLETA